MDANLKGLDANLKKVIQKTEQRISSEELNADSKLESKKNSRLKFKLNLEKMGKPAVMAQDSHLGGGENVERQKVVNRKRSPLANEITENPGQAQEKLSAQNVEKKGNVPISLNGVPKKEALKPLQEVKRELKEAVQFLEEISRSPLQVNNRGFAVMDEIGKILKEIGDTLNRPEMKNVSFPDMMAPLMSNLIDFSRAQNRKDGEWSLKDALSNAESFRDTVQKASTKEKVSENFRQEDSSTMTKTGFLNDKEKKALDGVPEREVLKPLQEVKSDLQKAVQFLEEISQGPLQTNNTGFLFMEEIKKTLNDIEGILNRPEMQNVSFPDMMTPLTSNLIAFKGAQDHKDGGKFLTDALSNATSFRDTVQKASTKEKVSENFRQEDSSTIDQALQEKPVMRSIANDQRIANDQPQALSKKEEIREDVKGDEERQEAVSIDPIPDSEGVIEKPKAPSESKLDATPAAPASNKSKQEGAPAPAKSKVEKKQDKSFFSNVADNLKSVRNFFGLRGSTKVESEVTSSAALRVTLSAPSNVASNATSKVASDVASSVKTPSKITASDFSTVVPAVVQKQAEIRPDGQPILEPAARRPSVASASSKNEGLAKSLKSTVIGTQPPGATLTQAPPGVANSSGANATTAVASESSPGPAGAIKTEWDWQQLKQSLELRYKEPVDAKKMVVSASVIQDASKDKGVKFELAEQDSAKNERKYSYEIKESDKKGGIELRLAPSEGKGERDLFREAEVLIEGFMEQGKITGFTDLTVKSNDPRLNGILYAYAESIFEAGKNLEKPPITKASASDAAKKEKELLEESEAFKERVAAFTKTHASGKLKATEGTGAEVVVVPDRSSSPTP